VSDTIGDANGSDAILAFLQTRRGYCVHFASAMAVMARGLGIPARVAVGFTPGVADGQGGHTVGLHDLHSWPELYFEGSGWVRFEPTPSERTGLPPTWARPDVNGAGGGGAPVPSSTADPSDTAPNARNREGAPLVDPRNGGGGSVGAGPISIPVVPLLIVLGVLVLLAVPAVTRLIVRRRRWSRAGTPSGRARAAWADLQDTLLDFGYVWQDSDPPRRGTARLVEARSLEGEAAEAAYRIAGATEQARYAPMMTADVDGLRDDVEAVRGHLSASASRWGRWRARLLPRSTRAVSGALAERFADALDAMDAAVASLTGRLRLHRG
jgi:hypothetical protein